jgi:phenylacetate-CoA ligase
MLISTAERWQELQDARGQARKYRGHVPDAEFYRRKLAAVWERARHTSAHADLPDFSPAAFAAVPVTSKDELKGAPWDFAAAGIADAAKYYESSGTGGRSTPTPRLAADVIWNTVSVAEAWSSLLEQDDRVLIMLPSDIVPVADLIANVCEYLDLPHIRAYPFTTGMVDWDRLIALWASFRPTAVFAAPGVAIQFTRLLRQRQMMAEVADPVTTIMLLGEVSTEPLRARLGQWWDARAMDASYGSTETGTIAASCRAGRQHLISASHYVELADSRGVSTLCQQAPGQQAPGQQAPGQQAPGQQAPGQQAPAARGAGHLIVTPLNLHARPLLRQDTGDWVRIGDRCACGSDCPVIEVHGRSSEVVDIHGVSLSARAVEELVYTAEGTTGYLIEITEAGDYARLVLERDLPGKRPGEDKVLASLRDAFHDRLAVAWDGMVFVNSLSGLTKSGASQKNWKRSNVRVLSAAAS